MSIKILVSSALCSLIIAVMPAAASVPAAAPGDVSVAQSAVNSTTPIQLAQFVPCPGGRCVK